MRGPRVRLRNDTPHERTGGTPVPTRGQSTRVRASLAPNQFSRPTPPMLRLRCCFCVFLGASLAVLPANAADAKKTPDPKTLPAPQRIVVPKLRGPIAIDGELRE